MFRSLLGTTCSLWSCGDHNPTRPSKVPDHAWGTFFRALFKTSKSQVPVFWHLSLWCYCIWSQPLVWYTDVTKNNEMLQMQWERRWTGWTPWHGRGQCTPEKPCMGQFQGCHITAFNWLTRGTKTCGMKSQSQWYLQIPYRLRNKKVFPWVTAPGFGGGFLLPSPTSQDSMPLLNWHLHLVGDIILVTGLGLVSNRMCHHTHMYKHTHTHVHTYTQSSSIWLQACHMSSIFMSQCVVLQSVKSVKG